MARVSDNIEKLIEELANAIEIEYTPDNLILEIDPSQLLQAQQIVAVLSLSVFNELANMNLKGEL